MPVDTIPLFHGNYYHIYNIGNNQEKIFLDEQNYQRFLGDCASFLEPAAEMCAYCLLPDHVHLLVRIRDLDNEIQGITEMMKVIDISDQLFHLFDAYSKAFNKQYLRKGRLFSSSFQRKQVNSRTDLAMLVRYIHQNPERHRITSDFRTWKYSTYSSLLDSGFTSLPRSTVFSWFGGRDAFVSAHARWLDPWLIQSLIIEQDRT